MEYDWNDIIKWARRLGIKLTNANLDTELCGCWADRVLIAKKAFKQGDLDHCQTWIDEANSYAI
jgi:hypothetical protein